ncbi:MAG: aldehyde dehydrogenase family protein, partial [Propionibacteriaceae bacterium]
MNPTQTAVTAVLEHASGVRINGEPTISSETRSLISPADGAEIARVHYGTREAADAALAASEQSLPAWAATPVGERAAVLRAMADDLAAAAGEGTPDGGWAWLISTETGKRVAEAAAELNLSATYCRVFADLLEAQREETFDVVPGVRHRVEAHPVGPVAVLTPWNFPVSIPMRKLAPVLAAGCTAVFKPSELAPLSSIVLAELLDRHLPIGTANTVLGDPDQVATPWLNDPRVRAVTFTGSTRVGRLVAEAVAARFLPSVLELGGCAPFVVLDDADLDHAADTLMIGKFRNNGQSCIAANQVF